MTVQRETEIEKHAFREFARANAIVTSFVYPPIPVRQFDWCAYRDGCEEDGQYGYGATEEEAIADFVDLYEEEC